MHHSIDRIAHTMAFVTPVVEQWLEQEIACTKSGCATMELYLAPCCQEVLCQLFRGQFMESQFPETSEF